MSAKISAARRAAFLRALEETGNQTLAGERAKVSRSWVVNHRREHPEFDAAVRAAVEKAKETLIWAPDQVRGDGPSNRPPVSWGFLDGEELVVRGSGGSGPGRRVQVARARIRQWSPRVEDRFLAVLTATCNVKAACAEVRLTAASAYAHRKRWTAFARRWDEAIEIGYRLLLLGLVEQAGNPFSGTGQPEPARRPRMGVDETLHNLFMHQHQVDGLGARPGLPAGEMGIEEAKVRILRAIDAIEGGKRLGEEEKARQREDYARRRRG